MQLAQILRHEWGDFRQEPLTKHKAWLGEQAAYFLAIPPSVAVHEFFHALPIWAFGGRITRCGYGFYWGFVQSDRFFPANQEWLISLAGTIGSLLFGLGLWWLLRQHPSSAVRFFAIRSLRIQLFYSLIFYPIFSAASFIGDWRVIYDFTATPILSGATAVAHGLTLGAFWYGQRQGWFEMRQAESPAELAKIRQLEAAAAAHPHDLNTRLSYVRALRHANAASQARQEAQNFTRDFPNIGEGFIELALIQLLNQSRMPRTALDSLRQALSLPIQQTDYLITAHLLLGQHKLQTERLDEAVNHFSYGIEVANAIPGEAQPKLLGLAQAHHLRATAYQQQNQKALALADVEQAIELARVCGREAMMKNYQLLKQKIHSMR